MNEEYIQNVYESQLKDAHVPTVRSTVKFASFASNLEIEIKESVKNYGNALQEYIDLIEQYYYPSEAKERETYKQLLYVWRLTELLQFDLAQQPLSEALMTWFNEAHRPLYFEYNKQAIIFDGALDRPDFWKFAIRMAVLGQLSQIALLFQHVLKNSQFAKLSQILAYILEVRNHIQHGHVDRENMQKTLISIQKTPFLDQVSRNHASQMISLMSVLLGDEKAILQHTTSDIHALVCLAYYQRTESIQALAQTFYSKHKQCPQSIARSLLTNDLYTAIEQGIQYDWWFLAHWTDLLHSSNRLDRPIQIQTGTGMVSLPVKNHFILYYASFLFNQCGLWKESFAYLLQCDDIGRSAIAKHLNNIDLTLEDEKIEDIVSFCQDYGFEQSLYQKKADLCLAQKNYAKSLNYYRLANQVGSIDQLFYDVIRHFAMTGQWIDLTYEQDGLYYTIYRSMLQIAASHEALDFSSAAHLFKQLIKQANIPSTLLPIIVWDNLTLVDDINFGYLDKQNLLDLKSLCQSFSKYAVPEDFELFCYHIQPKTDPYQQQQKPTLDQLIFSMNEFLDTSAVKISRAIERTLENTSKPYLPSISL
ncbi:Nuclear pore complex protein Nup85 [Choanephora cucurbitarum]|uniref:Nuclear pore complex protein Nup85 n=1 Tax=Choanephora cucurbitarum TaxID=101091 RepID=A0A1C7NR81_9FUNG|nr:Nuclear pore complex protein Nup85 [Choanephora cucurbitarum]